MAYITTMEVGDNTIKLMEGLGFKQIPAISPNIQWSNWKGMRIMHLPHQTPKTVDDVFQLIYNNGYNTGVIHQVQNTKSRIIPLVEKIINDTQLGYLDTITNKCAE